MMTKQKLFEDFKVEIYAETVFTAVPQEDGTVKFVLMDGDYVGETNAIRLVDMQADSLSGRDPFFEVETDQEDIWFDRLGDLYKEADYDRYRFFALLEDHHGDINKI